MLTKEEYIKLYEKYLSGDCSVEELRQLERYEDKFQWKEGVWHEETIGDKAAVKARIYARLRDEMQESIYAEKKQRFSVSKWITYAAAAIVLVIGSVYWLFLNKEPQPLAEDHAVIIAPGGDKAILILDDGTEVSLNELHLGDVAIDGKVLANKTGEGELRYGEMAEEQIKYHTVDWKASHDAFEQIIALTEKYNALNGGKWNRMMDYKPRNLPVFERVKEEEATDSMMVSVKPLLTLNGADLVGNTSILDGLGYEGKAVALDKGEEAHYDLSPLQADSIRIAVRVLPNHPVEGDELRFGIALDDMPTQEISYKTKGRSEEWKMNVLRNQAVREITFPTDGKEKTRIKITALDKGVVVDQVLVFVL